MEGGASKRRDDRWMDRWKELACSNGAPHWGILGNPLNHGAPFPDRDTGPNWVKISWQGLRRDRVQSSAGAVERKGGVHLCGLCERQRLVKPFLTDLFLSVHPTSFLWGLCGVSNMLKWNWCGVNHCRLRKKLPTLHPSSLRKRKSGNIDKWFIWSAVWIFKIGLRE